MAPIAPHHAQQDACWGTHPQSAAHSSCSAMRWFDAAPTAASPQLWTPRLQHVHAHTNAHKIAKIQSDRLAPSSSPAFT